MIHDGYSGVTRTKQFSGSSPSSKCTTPFFTKPFSVRLSAGCAVRGLSACVAVVARVSVGLVSAGLVSVGLVRIVVEVTRCGRVAAEDGDDIGWLPPSRPPSSRTVFPVPRSIAWLASASARLFLPRSTCWISNRSSPATRRFGAVLIGRNPGHDLVSRKRCRLGRNRTAHKRSECGNRKQQAAHDAVSYARDPPPVP